MTAPLPLPFLATTTGLMAWKRTHATSSTRAGLGAGCSHRSASPNKPKEKKRKEKKRKEKKRKEKKRKEKKRKEKKRKEMKRNEKKRKGYVFLRSECNEQPSIIPGCPGGSVKQTYVSTHPMQMLLSCAAVSLHTVVCGNCFMLCVE